MLQSVQAYHLSTTCGPQVCQQQQQLNQQQQQLNQQPQITRQSQFNQHQHDEFKCHWTSGQTLSTDMKHID